MVVNTLCLTANQVQCQRGNKCLFSELSFKVSAGQMLLITGANGIGKTTLLRAILGLQDYLGNILWGSVDIADQRSLYHEALYYVGHQLSMSRDYTVLQQLTETCLFAGRTQPSATELLEHLAQQELNIQATSIVTKLSAGQKKRLLLSVAPILSKKLWIFDEPMANLDAHARVWLLQIIEEFRLSGGMVILTSHEESQFQRYASHQVVLS